MRANELVIGDWVYYENSPVQIKGIDSFKGEYVSFGDEFYPYEDFDPIPLTPEILKKNDFKYGDGYGYSFVNRKELSGDGFEEEKVYINTALNTLIIYTAASSIHLPVKYIHELQHALKLCGIEKEIVL